jgi:hypothetical protein
MRGRDVRERGGAWGGEESSSKELPTIYCCDLLLPRGLLI